MQSAVQLYGLGPPNNMGDADINVTVVTAADDPGVSVYCNPMYGQYLLDNSTRPTNYPQPGFAVWQSSAPRSLWPCPCTFQGGRSHTESFWQEGTGVLGRLWLRQASWQPSTG